MPTIKEIAKITGVSIGTVDRALHNRGRVSAETKFKILQAAEKTGYSTNIFARNLKLSKVFNFSVFMPHPSCDSNYWKIPVNGINKALKEFSHYKINVNFHLYNKYNNKNIEAVFNGMLKIKYDGYIVVPTGENIFGKILKSLPVNSPCVFFDSLMPGYPHLSFIGQDPYKSGITGAKLMHLLTGNNPRIALINYKPEDFHIKQRTLGFRTYFEDVKNAEVKVLEVEQDYKLNTKNILNNLIKKEKYPLNGIFVSSAPTYIAAEYLEKINLAGKVKLVGYDLLEENIKYLKKGVIDFIISQMSERQGYEALNCLINSVILKQEVECEHLMQIDIITRENVDFYRS